MGCNCRGSAGTPTPVGTWTLKLADGTRLPYATEWEARQAAARNPGSTYAWVTKSSG